MYLEKECIIKNNEFLRKFFLIFKNLINTKNLIFKKALVFCIISYIFHATYIPFKFIPYEKIYFLVASLFLTFMVLIQYGAKVFNSEDLKKSQGNFIKKVYLYFYLYQVEVFKKDYILLLTYCTFFVIFFLFSFFISLNAGLLPSAESDFISFLAFPLYAGLGLFCSKFKETSVKSIFFLSFVYFGFCMDAFLNGVLSFSSKGFINIFSNHSNILTIKTSIYQNVNLYLGIFSVILSSFLYKSNTNNFLKVELLNSLRKRVFLNFKLLNALIISCKKIFIISILLASAMFMAIIASRASFLSAIFVVLLQTYFYIRQYYIKLNYKRKMLFLIFLFISIITIGFMLYSSPIDFLVFKRLSILNQVEEDPSARLRLWSYAVSLFCNSPIFGGGIGSFQEYIGSGVLIAGVKQAGWYPHNFILELLCETGLLGTAFFFAPFYSIYKKSMNVVKNDFYTKVSFYIFLFLFLISMFCGSLQDVKILVFFFFLTLGNLIYKVQDLCMPCLDKPGVFSG